MLSFLLDIAELPEVRDSHSITSYITTNTYFQSHTGVAMANAFQAMLEQFGLTEKILTVNADNATSNDKQKFSPTAGIGRGMQIPYQGISYFG
jgi:hypothetical protein